MGYIRGLGGHCCESCTPDDACTEKPVVTGGSASGTVGSAFSYSISATHSPTSYSASGLPAGLSINTTTGVISGTPTACFSGSVTIGATNACGTGTASLALTISGPSPSITSASSATGTEGSAFTFNVTASNSPTSYGVTGTLPPGLSLNTTTGQITGTPTGNGIYTVTVSATNACGTGTGSLTITIYEDSCPTPTLLCDSISASHTKFGFTENACCVSSPAKIYRRRTFDGSLTETVYNNPDTGGNGCNPADLIATNVTTYSGYCEYDLDANVTTNTLAIDGAGIGCGDGFVAGCDGVGECPPITNATTVTKIGAGTCNSTYPAHKWNGTATDTLSNEYTTAQLITHTEGKLPAYPGTWDGVCQSLRDLDATESTYSIARFKYKFQLPTLTGYTYYKIEWMEGATPRSYTWDGVATETPEYGPVLEPGSNGSVGITGITLECY